MEATTTAVTAPADHGATFHLDVPAERREDIEVAVESFNDEAVDEGMQIEANHPATTYDGADPVMHAWVMSGAARFHRQRMSIYVPAGETLVLPAGTRVLG